MLALVIASIGVAQQDKRLKGVEAELKAIMEATKAAGFAVAVVEGNRVVYAQGFGYSNYEKKIPVDANTLFAIGSVSKSFTSSILGQLRQESKLSFDDSPIKYIPDLRFYSDEMNRGITIKDMMCHRTGLPRHDMSWYLFPTHSKDSLMSRIAYLEPFTSVRSQWHYNNFMYLVQGVITERITGKSWEENIKERLLIPLEMTRSNTTINEMKSSPNAALGYGLKKDSVIYRESYYDIAAMGPAGSINSSVNDMSTWLITWLNKGKYKGKQILPESYVAEAISSQMVIKGALPDKEYPDIYLSNYGYAWYISSYRGHYQVAHGGNIDGFSANMAFFPSDSLGIVVLTNQNYSSLPSLVRNTIADRMLKEPSISWCKEYLKQKDAAAKESKKEKLPKELNQISSKQPSHLLTDYEGIFDNPGYGSIRVVNKNDSLYAQIKNKTFLLRHRFFDIFDAIEIADSGVATDESNAPRFNFSTNDEGKIAGINIKMESTIDRPILFKSMQVGKKNEK